MDATAILIFAVFGVILLAYFLHWLGQWLEDRKH